VARKQRENAAFWLQTYLPELEATAREKLAQLADLHMRYNGRGRLSAPLTPERYVVHLVMDSLALITLIKPAAAATVADVGSGGGYPGLPVAIVRGDLAVTLLEPNKRKAAYLELAARELGLANVAVKALRAEEDEGRYDLVTAKAMGKPAAALKAILPLLKPAGRAALFAGPSARDEDAAAVGGARLVARHAYHLPGYDQPRYLLEWAAG